MGFGASFGVGIDTFYATDFAVGGRVSCVTHYNHEYLNVILFRRTLLGVQVFHGYRSAFYYRVEFTMATIARCKWHFHGPKVIQEGG